MIEINVSVELTKDNDISKPFHLTNEQREKIHLKKLEIEKALSGLKCLRHFTHRTVVLASWHESKWEWEIKKCCCDELDNNIMQRLLSAGLVYSSEIVLRQDDY